MIRFASREICCGCGACENACPADVISMRADCDGFVYPEKISSACLDCGKCKSVCPVLNPDYITNGTPLAFAAINNCESERLASSSGGMFTLFARQIIAHGGTVFGVALNENLLPVFIAVRDDAALSLIAGSKYAQAPVGDTYKQVKEILDGGSQVLFGATPCQCAGLLSFLGKDYENLYCLDVACHSVASPLMLRKWLDSHGSPTSLSFRDKSGGWQNYSVTAGFANGEKLSSPHMDNTYMRAFLKHLISRKSCALCQFKGISRKSDITLADFWGVQKFVPGLCDDKGVSLLLIHSEKGKRLFDSVLPQCTAVAVDPEKAVEANPAITSPFPHSEKREKFFETVAKKDFDRTVKAFTQPPLSVRLRSRLSEIKQKIFR